MERGESILYLVASARRSMRLGLIDYFSKKAPYFVRAVSLNFLTLKTCTSAYEYSLMVKYLANVRDIVLPHESLLNHLGRL